MKRLLLCLLVLILSGCAKKPDPIVVQSPTSNVRQQLMAQHTLWQGTPYQYGGTSRNGVDCSGFVQLTFLNRLSIQLPRTTLLQSQLGYEVDRTELKVGDLVFFKTNIKVRHVGVYLGDARFLHASTSEGVTISSLNNLYWSPRFWMARRVF